MASKLTISLDGMGGDKAPNIVIEGAAIARERQPNAYFIIFGDEAVIRPLLSKFPTLSDCVEIRHTDQAISNDAKPSQALRTGKKSSMGLAIGAVKDGEADCVVSAGNTGALMAMSMFGLRTLPGIDRPAISSFFPTLRGESCMLDLGANVECNAQNLVQFSVMGEVFARTVLGIEKPTIGLLNIGTEDLKGKDEVKLAASIIRDSTLPIDFEGFVEGDDIAKGTVDVVVTDGFTGNVALKTAEGTSRLISAFIRETFQSSLLAKIGYLLARGAIKKLRMRLDPSRYNGAVFLGLNGIVVKSHGGTDALGFANAIGVAADMALHGFIDKMREDFSELPIEPATSPKDEAENVSIEPRS